MSDDIWFHRIKAAQRDLIRLCGGIDRAATVASISPSQMGRFNSAKDPDVMAIPVVIALESECGEAPVTDVMAGLNGRRLSDPEQERQIAANVLASYADLKRAGADLDTEMALALADGDFTATELQRADQRAAHKQDALSKLRAAIAGAKAAAGAKTALRVVGRED